MKQVDYARIKDINFSSARKLKTDLDKSIQRVDSPVSEPRPPSHTSTPTCPEEGISATQEPSPDELIAFCHSFSECKIKPVCLSLIHPYKALTDLFDLKYLDLSYPELVKECYKVHLNLSEEDIQSIEKETVDQAIGNAFFRHRAGRIGASKCRAASHTDPTKPSQSFVKAIFYPGIFCFTTAAIKHGCNKRVWLLPSMRKK